LARDAFGGRILQQTVMNVPAPVLGQNEHRLPESRARAIGIINARLRMAADSAGVDLVALDQRIGHDGLANWHDPVLWTRAKQEIRHFASPFYGDMVGRLLAAQQGRAAKCLVLDLDNTLWGGVIGDDGLAGIVVGQGSSAGEGYLAVQSYAKDLSRRGIILAVCSKNDEVNAWEPFDKHPEMVLKRSDIACLQANWNDKPHNIKIIAESLNIGLDSMVFLEDNPFERTLVREQLPMVAVPEFPDEPAMVPQMLADAGYFEAPSITENDRSRSEQYQGNLARQQF
jgi:HAD superfamily phosphatase (TIGR01681 family)